MNKTINNKIDLNINKGKKMNAKKIYVIVVCVLMIILGVVIWSFFNGEKEVINNIQEIVPEKEISDEQLRNTIISLYFINSDTGEIEIENRMIDAKKLLNNPYNELLNLWILGPNNEKLKTNCTKEIKINNIEVIENCAVIDLSENFIDEYKGEKDSEFKVINCIVNTLTELTEVDSIKILINGQENQYLGNANLSEKYCRINN